MVDKKTDETHENLKPWKLTPIRVYNYKYSVCSKPATFTLLYKCFNMRLKKKSSDLGLAWMKNVLSILHKTYNGQLLHKHTRCLIVTGFDKTFFHAHNSKIQVLHTITNRSGRYWYMLMVALTSFLVAWFCGLSDVHGCFSGLSF